METIEIENNRTITDYVEKKGIGVNEYFEWSNFYCPFPPDYEEIWGTNLVNMEIDKLVKTITENQLGIVYGQSESLGNSFLFIDQAKQVIPDEIRNELRNMLENLYIHGQSMEGIRDKIDNKMKELGEADQINNPKEPKEPKPSIWDTLFNFDPEEEGAQNQEEEEEPTDGPEYNDDGEPAQEKSPDELLVEKVDKAIACLKVETNPALRGIYTAQLTILKQRMEREINEHKIKTAADQEKVTADEEEDEDINYLYDEVDEAERIAESNNYADDAYNPNSKNFKYKVQLDRMGNSIENLYSWLEERGQIGIVERIKAEIERENRLQDANATYDAKMR